MSKSIVTLIVLAVAAAPLGAQGVRVQSGQVKVKDAEVQRAAPQAEMKKAQAEAAAQTDQGLQQLAEQAAAGKVGTQYMKRLEQALAKDPSLEPYRARLEAYVAALRAHADKGDVTPADVKRLQTGVADARFESAFRELHEKVQRRGATEADFDRLAQVLVERSLAAKGLALDLGKHRKRLDQAIVAMKQRYLSGELKAEELDVLHEQMATARIHAELGDLEQQVGAGRATDADFAGVRTLIRERAAALTRAGAADADLEQRMTQALDKIQQRAQQGGAVTAEEYAALRTSLTKRAREAGAPR